MATSAQENRDVVPRYLEESWKEAALDFVAELVAAEAPHHDPTFFERSTGPAARKQSLHACHTACPDVHSSIEEMVAGRGLVAVGWTARATHEGELIAVESTGPAVEITGMSIDRVKEGQIAETRDVYDTPGLLQQIGPVPEQSTG